MTKKYSLKDQLRGEPPPLRKIYQSHIEEAARENLDQLLIKHGLKKPDEDKR